MGTQEMESSLSGYQLPDELRTLQMKARTFNAEEIIPLEAKLDYDAEFLPKEHYDRLVKKVKAQGMWALDLPEEYSGREVSSFAQCIAMEEWCQHRAGIYCPGYGVYGPPNLPSVIWGGTKEQIKKYAIPATEQGYNVYWGASEAGPGSDYTSIQTRAEKKGDHYILNGTKFWASGASHSPWGLVTARTGEDRYGGISIFIIEDGTPGVTITEQPCIRQVMVPCKVVLDNVKVSKENLLGEEGQGATLAAKWFNKGRAPYSATNIGVAVAANRLAIEFAKERVVFGEPLSKKQAIQQMIVDSEIEIRAARWLVWEAAWKIDRGEDARLEVSMAKVASSETLGRVVDRAVQIHGAYGVDKMLPLERWYRESRIRRIGRGPSEAHRFRTIARILLNE